MKKTKSRGISEIKVRLLPEKAKRDYVMRLVSYIIVMVFIIVNFFLIFLPRTKLIEQINIINSRIAVLESQYNNTLNNLFDLSQLFDKYKIYNIPRNQDVTKIVDHEIDYNYILSEFNAEKPEHSFIESVSYNDERGEFLIIIQFDTLLDLTTFQTNVNSLNYISGIKAGGYSIVKTPQGLPRYKTKFLITLDMVKAPRVGDVSE